MRTRLTALAESKSKEEWQELYDSHTLKEIGVEIGLGPDARVPVKKILKYHGIALRPCGQGPNGSNRTGTGLQIPEEDLLGPLSHKQLAEKYDIPRGSARRLRAAIGVYHRKKPLTDPYRKYCYKVRKLTEQVYRQHIDILNPERHPRGLHGVEGAYQIDHLKGLRQCYEEGVSPEECASLENLELVTWEENLDRRNYL